MSVESFARLYIYDNEVNRRVLHQLRSMNNVSTKIREVFAHLLQAKRLWMWRMRGDDYKDLVVWPKMSWDDCEQLIEDNARDWNEFITGLRDDDLEGRVVYTNTKGIEYDSSVRDILTHVLIHGGYHRGQIALAVRQAGGEPLLTDYIAWTRE